MPPTRTTLPVAPLAPAPRRRRAPISAYKYVRKVAGNAWQARVWLGQHAGGSLNLGLFTVADHPAEPGRPDDEVAEWVAARASRAFWRFYRPYLEGHDLRGTLEELKRRGFIPPTVLPPRVKRVGEGFRAIARRGDRTIETPAYGCPWLAHDAICAALNSIRHRGNE